MTTKKRLAILLAREDGPAALAELGYVQVAAEKEAYDKAYTSGVAIGMKQARQKYIEVANLAEQANLDASSFIALIRQGSDLAEAWATIQAMPAKASKKQGALFTANPPTPMATITT